MKFELKENEKERSREKEKENSSTSTTTKDRMNSGKDPLPPVRIPFSAALLRDAAKRIGMPSDEVRGWCEHCDGVGCACGIKIPPAHQSWPKPPRECPAFKAKEAS